ncbi:hypothetical protein F2Q68_00028215 [Brassica cretica]|uniref:PRA1 family protein n=1 Tax=Brassica cretica TaxID=69181 RepID=A0A8S9IE65_BRACR|nr:hypothetical protein F2Q68_00028215 [Brassica cretica]
MIFMFAFLAVVAPIPGASTPTPPNPSDSTPSGSMTPRDSELLDNSTLPIQSNTSPSSLAHPTQPGEDSNPIPLPYLRHPYTSPVTQLQNNASSSAHPYTLSPVTQSSQVTQRQNNASSPSSAHPTRPVLIHSRYFRNPFSTSSESQSNSNSLLPVFQRPSQSTTRVPWYHGNAFYAAERASHGIPPNEYHLMDHLSSSVIQYVFDWGINFSSQRPNPNINIYSQAFLNQGALSLFLLANAVFPRTHPALAFSLDRLSFLLIVISTYLAFLYMFPPYVAIIPILVIAIIYMFSHFRR